MDFKSVTSTAMPQSVSAPVIDEPLVCKKVWAIWSSSPPPTADVVTVVRRTPIASNRTDRLTQGRGEAEDAIARSKMVKDGQDHVADEELEVSINYLINLAYEQGQLLGDEYSA